MHSPKDISILRIYSIKIKTMIASSPIGVNMATRSLVMGPFELLTSGVVTDKMFVAVMVVESVVEIRLVVSVVV